jgi:hypothetical protein
MAWLLVACLVAADPAIASQSSLPQETPQQRQTRLTQIARKRAGVVVLVDGGATEFGPSHSLRAISAASQLGATGVRLIVRSSQEGLVVFSDPSMFRRLDSVDSVCALKLSDGSPPYADKPFGSSQTTQVGRAWDGVLTLAAALHVLREDAALVDLVLETPTMTNEVLDALRRFDLLDHVVRVEGGDDSQVEAAEKSGLRQLPFAHDPAKAIADCEPHVVTAMLQRPCVACVVGDPRLSLSLLRRPALPVRSKKKIYKWERQDLAAPVDFEAKTSTHVHRPLEVCPGLPRDVELERSRVFREGVFALGALASDNSKRDAILQKALSSSDRSVRSEAILASARIALGQRPTTGKGELRRLDEEIKGGKLAPAEVDSAVAARGRIALAMSLSPHDPEEDEMLVAVLSHPTPTQNPLFAGVDAAAAARALGRRGVKPAVGVLKKALLQPITGGAESVDAIARERIARESAIALAAIGGDEAIVALETAMNLPEDERANHPKELASIAASALARFNAADRAPILAKLIVHGLPEVRREGVLGCLREPGSQYRTLLEFSADWAVPWWDVQHRPK